jgi:hypothetical protein
MRDPIMTQPYPYLGRIDAGGVRRTQRFDYFNGFGAVDFFGTQGAASFVGVAPNRRDDVRATRARYLHRVAADPAKSRPRQRRAGPR